VRYLITARTAEVPPRHPLETLLAEAPDFRQEAELADALLHPQDRAYSVHARLNTPPKWCTKVEMAGEFTPPQRYLAACLFS